MATMRKRAPGASHERRLADNPRSAMSKLFVVLTTKTHPYDPAKPLEEQFEWDGHAAFMDELAASEFVALGGPFDDSPEALLIVRANDIDEVTARLAPDPWQKNGMLRVS